MALDDPELARYPVAYMAEPGFWVLTEAEAAAFRAYLEKGGFVIFDDFAENRGGWDVFRAQMKRVIPGRQVGRTGRQPSDLPFVFRDSDPLKFLPPYDQELKPSYLGLFEDNDTSKRLMAIVNLQQRHLGVLGVLGPGICPRQRHQRGVQAGRELRHLWADALTAAMTRRVMQTRRLGRHP